LARSPTAIYRRTTCPQSAFLKAPGYQDGHADYSDPLDEQQFIANEINALQHTPNWSSTAVIIAYDDSDGEAVPGSCDR
jgi:phospholipase C